MREHKETNGVTARDGLGREERYGRKDGRRRRRRRRVKGAKKKKKEKKEKRSSSGPFPAAVVGTGATQLGAVVHT